jgi:hypothetical protein
VARPYYYNNNTEHATCRQKHASSWVHSDTRQKQLKKTRGSPLSSVILRISSHVRRGRNHDISTRCVLIDSLTKIFLKVSMNPVRISSSELRTRTARLAS